MIQQVNLYKSEFYPRSQRLTANTGLVLVLLLIALVLVSGGWFRYQAVGFEQAVVDERANIDRLLQSIESLEQEMQGRRPDPELEPAIERVTDTLARRKRLFDQVGRLANNRSGGFSASMTALARQIPEGLWLTGLNLQPNSITLEGRTGAGDLVPLYLERIGEETAFTGQFFSGFDLSRSEEHPWIKFRVATDRDREDDQ